MYDLIVAVLVYTLEDMCSMGTSISPDFLVGYGVKQGRLFLPYSIA